MRLRHFRSFDDTRLPLGGLTVLVGENGSGKTNLLDAFEFIREALTDSLTVALDRRGGLASIRERHTDGKPHDVWVAVLLEYHEGRSLYGFRLGTTRNDSQLVVREEVLTTSGAGALHFARKPGVFNTNLGNLSPVVDDESLLLPLVAGQDPLWKQTLEVLTGMRAYTLSPPPLKLEPPIDHGKWLSRDGSNLGDVLSSVQKKKAEYDWVLKYLSRVASGVGGVKAAAESRHRRIYFERSDGQGGTHDFLAAEMSDGTLRALGLLVALRQPAQPRLTLIDEIEDSIHPGALPLLMDAIVERSARSQVVITTHSPEALSHRSVTPAQVRVIDWRDGDSSIYQLQAESDLPESIVNVGDLLHARALGPTGSALRSPGEFFDLSSTPPVPDDDDIPF